MMQSMQSMLSVEWGNKLIAKLHKKRCRKDWDDSFVIHEPNEAYGE
jgi:hypothetical protein